MLWCASEIATFKLFQLLQKKKRVIQLPHSFPPKVYISVYTLYFFFTLFLFYYYSFFINFLNSVFFLFFFFLFFSNFLHSCILLLIVSLRYDKDVLPVSHQLLTTILNASVIFKWIATSCFNNFSNLGILGEKRTPFFSFTMVTLHSVFIFFFFAPNYLLLKGYMSLVLLQSL